MATPFRIDTRNSLIRLPQEGPLLGWTRWSSDANHVVAKLFATADDSDSLPALALLLSYLNRKKERLFFGELRASGPPNANGSVVYLPYYVLEISIPVEEFSEKGEICLEVLSFHTLSGATLSDTLKDLNALAGAEPYGGLKAHLTKLQDKRRRTLYDPSPESRSFENRYDRNLNEAIVTLRVPPKTTEPEKFKFIATTCRYPGFAFESQRVDAASFDIIADKHSDASGMLMLGDQIYADATADLFDNLTSIEKFQARYHRMFRSPGFAKAVRAIPCYMTGDDHEFSDSWSVPDDSLRKELYQAAQQSYGIYQMSHSPFKKALNEPPFDYYFTSGPVAVYVMDTISNRSTKTPGEERIVSEKQLDAFKGWLTEVNRLEFVMLATGGVVAPGFRDALVAGKTDVSRAQGFENWQAFDEQRIRLLDIIAASTAKVLLVSGDYHCAAKATIAKGGEVIKAVVVPPAYAPMRYVNAPVKTLAKTEMTGDYVITLDESQEGSGFAIITIESGDWAVKFETKLVADT